MVGMGRVTVRPIVVPYISQPGFIPSNIGMRKGAVLTVIGFTGIAVFLPRL
jgi:hypothetical protein